jgi:hypothetical protein
MAGLLPTLSMMRLCRFAEQIALPHPNPRPSLPQKPGWSVRQGAPGATSCSSAVRSAPRTFFHHQARGGRTPLILSIPRPCSLAEPTGPAQVSRAYLHMVSPGRGVFQRPATDGAATTRGTIPPAGRPVSNPSPWATGKPARAGGDAPSPMGWRSQSPRSRRLG